MQSQDYMMQKDTTCEKPRKLILPLQMSPSGIMDLSLSLTPSSTILLYMWRVKFCNPLYVEWNRSQNLTLTLHRLSSP
jgi:hypothetical protein